ncbi:MAG: META domain-containing protein [Bacteroidales bacterium]|jgi:heat shock protein HslJ|nr:META domain-containing protein [Bacteroidales bacterium]
MKKVLFFTTIITIVVIGCSSSQKTKQNADTKDLAINQPVTELPSPIGTRWKLVEINGKPIAEMTFATEPFIEFDRETKRVSGNSGCNNFSGEFEIDTMVNRIRFSNMVATKKACLDMTVETQLLEILSVVDNYSRNETMLSLNRARMAPLARFEAVK